MPLLMCPNCQSNMQSLNRASVEFDMCPTCRGVWLDRGELEKIMAQVRADAETDRMPASRPAQQEQPYQSHDAYRERGHGERGYDKRHKRKRGFDLFDIFD